MANSKYTDAYEHATQTLKKARTEFIALRESVLKEIQGLTPNSLRFAPLESFRLAVFKQAEIIQEIIDVAIEIPQDNYHQVVNRIDK